MSDSHCITLYNTEQQHNNLQTTTRGAGAHTDNFDQSESCICLDDVKESINEQQALLLAVQRVQAL